MPSSPTIRLLIHRVRRKSKSDESGKEEIQLRLGTRVSRRHATTISVPPTLLHTPIPQGSFYAPAEPTIIIYNSDMVETPSYTSMRDIRATGADEYAWIDIPTGHDENLLAGVAERFQIHPLALADIDTVAQRTKLAVFDDALFLVAKLIYLDRHSQKTCVDQICFYLKENVLITFQQQPHDIFDQIKNRIQQKQGRVRRSKIDYLFYLLFDTIVERYIDVFDKMGRKLEDVEERLLKTISRDSLETVYELKREMLYFRSSIAPLKEIINRLQKEEETQIIQESTVIYLKDLFDHVVQVNDIIDAYREMLSSFIDFYMMVNSNAMNEVMKMLTIISTIFIPLTFIGGVYGMNFDNMPEIHWKYGYLIVLTFMLSVTFIMLGCFKRKKWF